MKVTINLYELPNATLLEAVPSNGSPHMFCVYDDNSSGISMLVKDAYALLRDFERNSWILYRGESTEGLKPFCALTDYSAEVLAPPAKYASRQILRAFKLRGDI